MVEAWDKRGTSSEFKAIAGYNFALVSAQTNATAQVGIRETSDKEGIVIMLTLVEVHFIVEE